jgi:hypothetical protein
MALESCQHRKMPNAAPTLDPKEDDAAQCVDRLRPELQNLINQRMALNSLVWAINLNFAELIKLRGGDETCVLLVMERFLDLNRKQRDQGQVCYRRIKDVRSKLLASGFSLDAIMWALIGAIGNISRGLGIPPDEIDKAMGDMIMRLKMARQSSMN